MHQTIPIVTIRCNRINNLLNRLSQAEPVCQPWALAGRVLRSVVHLGGLIGNLCSVPGLAECRSNALLNVLAEGSFKGIVTTV